MFDNDDDGYDDDFVPDTQEGDIYHYVPVTVTRAFIKDDDPRVPVVVLMFGEVDPDDPDNEDNIDDKALTMTAAKTLIIELQLVIDSIVAGTAFDEEEDEEE